MLQFLSKYLQKIIIYITLLFLVLSCTEDPDLLLKNDDFRNAIKIYKKQLSNDYNNSNIRRKITFAYFDEASKAILANNSEGAKKNIEKGIIYYDEEDDETIKRYSNLICDLGKLYIEEAVINNDVNSNSIKNNKTYNLGISYINKSILLDENNSKGIDILNSLNEKNAEKYFNEGKKSYEKWFENQELEYLIFDSKKNLVKAKELKYSKSIEVDKLLDQIKDQLVKFASQTELYSFKLTDVFFNRKTNLLGINIRFFNNEIKGYRAVDPKQFTLYDIEGQKFKPYKKVEDLSGYKNVMTRRRLDANKSFKAMLVFDIGRKRLLKFDKLIWVSSKGEIAKKEFPNKRITKINLD